LSNGHVLVIGGARSGKTGYAERLAMRMGSKPVYLATATALDGEMRERVSTHQAQRSGRFTTVEEPVDVPAAIVTAAKGNDVILMDCVTLWITNLLEANMDVAAAVEELYGVLNDVDAARVILVSNEVGLGVVPDNPLGRSFRDIAGAAHQRLAEICDDVYFIAAGLPLVMKGGPPVTEAIEQNNGVHEA
jgi:adenosylcobinamide kinase / adenosylcobinamide-phosphate guanylyltransferase